MSSTFAYRGDIRASRQWLLVLGVTSLAGGLVGAFLLVRTSDSSFLRLLPWLMRTGILQWLRRKEARLMSDGVVPVRLVV